MWLFVLGLEGDPCCDGRAALGLSEQGSETRWGPCKPWLPHHSP